MVHHGLEVIETLEMIKNNVRSDSSVGKEAQGKYKLKHLKFWRWFQWVLFAGGIYVGWLFWAWVYHLIFG